MKTTVSIIVASHGEDSWRQLALSRAVPSAEAQEGLHEVIALHDPVGSVASARNEASSGATGDWLLFLDADDELAPGFLSAMKPMMRSRKLITPAIEFRRGNRVSTPRVFPEVDMRDGNWLTIGTAVPRSLFEEVGGFTDGIDLYEDWHLWARCIREGVDAVACPTAVYIAHVRTGSRNRFAHQLTRLYWHQWIGHDVFPESYDRTTASEDARKRLSTRHLRRL